MTGTGGSPASTLRACTWNQDGWNRGREAERAALLQELGVDLLCAQELSHSRFKVLLAALGDGWWGVFSLTARDGLPKPSSFWGVAVYGRSDAVTCEGEADVIGDLDDPSGPASLFWRRGVAVPVSTAGVGTLTVASVHVRPGAVVGKQKLEYVTRLGTWMATAPRPLVLGVDANGPGVQPDGSEGFWDVEEAVWGPAAAHGLADTWRSTKQPFSPTHVLKGGKGVRFDHVWVSRELEASSHKHLLDEAKAVGSDHALVIADLRSAGGGTSAG